MLVMIISNCIMPIKIQIQYKRFTFLTSWKNKIYRWCKKKQYKNCTKIQLGEGHSPKKLKFLLILQKFSFGGYNPMGYYIKIFSPPKILGLVAPMQIIHNKKNYPCKKNLFSISAIKIWNIQDVLVLFMSKWTITYDNENMYG